MFKKSSGTQGAFMLILGLAILAQTAAAVDTKDTRLLAQPAISHIADRVSSMPITSGWPTSTAGTRGSSRPMSASRSALPFRPDGKWIAFSAQYEGNSDVYVVSAEGGIPKRLTWHPGVGHRPGLRCPTGASVYFVSTRSMATPGSLKLYRVPVEGGFPEEFKIPSIYRAAVSPDGQYIAYSPLQDPSFSGSTTGAAGFRRSGSSR